MTKTGTGSDHHQMTTKRQPMEYTRDDFKADLTSKQVQHTQDPERFAAFYRELGKMKVQDNQEYRPWRTDWIKPKGKILELGCHVGFNLIHYAKQGFTCVGVDLSPTLLDQARERIAQQPPEEQKRITLHEAWIEQFDTPDRFDTILITQTLEHVIHPVPILIKAQRLLAPGGKIYVTAPGSKTGNNSHVRGITNGDMADYAQLSGLKITHWEPIPKITACILERGDTPTRNKYQRIVRNGLVIQDGDIDTQAKFAQFKLDVKDKKVIDLGCNLGEMCRLAKDQGAEVIGIDKNAQFIDQARVLNPDIPFLVGDDRTIFGHNDIVLASAMFHYVRDHERFFKNIARCTKLLAMDVWVSGRADDTFIRSHRGSYIPSRLAFETIAERYFAKVRMLGKAISPDKSDRLLYWLSKPKAPKPKAILIYGTSGVGKTTMANAFLDHDRISLDTIFMAFYKQHHAAVNMPYSVSKFVDNIPSVIKREYHLFHKRYVARLLRPLVGHNVVIEGYDMIQKDYRAIIHSLLADWEVEEMHLTRVWDKK